VIQRPTLARVSAPIDRTEHLGDRCGGPGGGHAGCSIRFDRFWSAALGTRYVEFGTNMGDVVVDEVDPGHDEACRETGAFAVIATCSTATRLAIVRYQEPGAGEPLCWRVQAQLWDARGTAPTVLPGDVDRAGSSATRWRFRFPRDAADGGDVSLDFDGARGSAALSVGDAREACVMLRLSR